MRDEHIALKKRLYQSNPSLGECRLTSKRLPEPLSSLPLSALFEQRHSRVIMETPGEGVIHGVAEVRISIDHDLQVSLHLIKIAELVVREVGSVPSISSERPFDKTKVAIISNDLHPH
jgi:hypothetical protein